MATAIGAYATAAAVEDMTGRDLAAADLTWLGLVCDRINQYIETQTRQVLAPITSAAYLYHGNGLSRIWLPMPASGGTTASIGGMRAVTLVELAPYTAATFETITADVALESRVAMNGPYRWLRFLDVVSGSYRTFRDGRANIRVTGTAGWSAIPDDITEMALDLALTAWNAREAGQQNLTGTDENGRPFIARFINARHRDTLKSYRLRMPT